MSRVEKNLGDLAQSRLYDLSDTFGTKWEVKYDRLPEQFEQFDELLVTPDSSVGRS